jgi:hypothetical protein
MLPKCPCAVLGKSYDYHMMNAATERSNRTKANNALHTLGLTYHESIPLVWIDSILTDNGFKATEEAIYCGRDGRSTEQVGDRTWLTLNWHKMESGRYEIVVYLTGGK